MESNGIKGRIHVSEATAEELRRHGCGSWLTQREDPIVAKGKGTMTTFFVNITGANTSVGTKSRRESNASSLSKMSSDGFEESATGLGDITESAADVETALDFEENLAVSPKRAAQRDVADSTPDTETDITPRRAVRSSDNLDVSC